MPYYILVDDTSSPSSQVRSPHAYAEGGSIPTFSSHPSRLDSYRSPREEASNDYMQSGERSSVTMEDQSRGSEHEKEWSRGGRPTSQSNMPLRANRTEGQESISGSQTNFQESRDNGADARMDAGVVVRPASTIEKALEQPEMPSETEKRPGDVVEITSGSNSSHTMARIERVALNNTESPSQDNRYIELGKLLSRFYELRDLRNDAEAELNEHTKEFEDITRQVADLKEQLQSLEEAAASCKARIDASERKQEMLGAAIKQKREELQLE